MQCAEAILAADCLIARAGRGARLRFPRQGVGDLLTLVREWIKVDLDAGYRSIGVRGFGRGLIRYPEAPGRDLSKLRYYRVQPNQLVVSNIKAWEGAIAVTPDSDEDLVASNRFLSYAPRGDAVSVAFLKRVLISRPGIEQLQRASPGSADRNRTLSISSAAATIRDTAADPTPRTFRSVPASVVVIPAMPPTVPSSFDARSTTFDSRPAGTEQHGNDLGIGQRVRPQPL